MVETSSHLGSFNGGVEIPTPPIRCISPNNVHVVINLEVIPKCSEETVRLSMMKINMSQLINLHAAHYKAGYNNTITPDVFRWPHYRYVLSVVHTCRAKPSFPRETSHVCGVCCRQTHQVLSVQCGMRKRIMTETAWTRSHCYLFAGPASCRTENW